MRKLPKIFIHVHCFPVHQYWKRILNLLHTTQKILQYKSWKKERKGKQRSDLRSAEPNWAADPIPNSPGVSASNLLRSAMAGMPELKLITAAVANATETMFFQHLDP